jgi:Xaa-Pro aminopeptidase
MNIDAFAARRQRLADAIRAHGGGLAIVPTGREVMRNRDSEYPYRADSYFAYLTGFPEPEAVLAMAVGAETRSFLFCRPKDAEREIWDGYRYGPEAAAARFGLDAAYDIARMDEILPTLMAGAPAVYASVGADPAIDARLQKWMAGTPALLRNGQVFPHVLVDVRVMLNEMRLVKDEAEIATMRKAGAIAAAGHARAMRATRPGLREYHIEAELLHAFRHAGAQAVAYNSIVAAGANTCVLHYRAGDTELKDGDLLLIDAGCELDNYASDITRSFPVSGRFTGPQRAIYDIVLAAQAAAIEAVRPGQHWNAPHEAAVRVLTQGLIDEGLVDGSLDEALERESYRPYYMHRTGHWIGLDVHDVGDYREPGPTEGTVRPWRTLRTGMALTVEPGLYLRPAENLPERFWNIGIRIEDDVLVTQDGCEVLTGGVPKEAAQIEAWMRG